MEVKEPNAHTHAVSSRQKLCVFYLGGVAIVSNLGSLH